MTLRGEGPKKSMTEKKYYLFVRRICYYFSSCNPNRHVNHFSSFYHNLQDFHDAFFSFLPFDIMVGAS